MKDVRVLLYFKFFNLELNENENGGEDEKNTWTLNEIYTKYKNTGTVPTYRLYGTVPIKCILYSVWYLLYTTTKKTQ